MQYIYYTLHNIIFIYLYLKIYNTYKKFQKKKHNNLKLMD